MKKIEGRVEGQGSRAEAVELILYNRKPRAQSMRTSIVDPLI